MTNTIDQDLIDDAVAAGFRISQLYKSDYIYITAIGNSVEVELAKFAQLQRERQASVQEPLSVARYEQLLTDIERYRERQLRYWKVLVKHNLGEEAELLIDQASEPTPSQSVVRELLIDACNCADGVVEQGLVFEDIGLIKLYEKWQARAQLSKPQPQMVKEAIKKIRALIQT